MTLLIGIGTFMITILSKLIEFIYHIIKRVVDKMKYYFSTLEGKKDSIIIGKEEYKISSKKKEKKITICMVWLTKLYFFA